MASGTTSVGAGLLEFFKVVVVHGAHDHGHVGCVGAGMAQHLECTGDVEVGHDDGAGPGQAGRNQRLQARRVAKHHRIASGRGLAHAVRVEVQRHVRNALGFEHAREVLPAPPVAADDDVLARVDGLAGNGGHLQRLLQPLAADEFHHDAVAVHHDERRGQHRQHHRCQDGVQQFRRHQRVFLGQRQQHKTELTGLRKVQAGCAATRPWCRRTDGSGQSPAPI